MLLRPSKRLDESIVELLSTRVGASAAWLSEQLNANVRPCSLQGVYHELRKLQSLGVVIKVKGEYHLSISWASELMQFADNVYENCIGSATAQAVLPEEGETRSWQFSSLLRLDDFWMQVMQVLYTETKSPSLFAWNPYPWFYFAQPEKVTLHYEFVKRERRKFYYIMGEDTFLTRCYLESVDPDIFEYSLTEPPFPVTESTYFTCVAPYLVEVIMDTQTCERISSLFSSITSESEMNYVRISGVLNQSVKAKVRIRHAEKKAARLQKKFANFFGVTA